MRLRLTPVLLAGLTVVAVGCGDGVTRLATMPVTGKVTFNKTTPAAGAYVVFHPLDAGFEKAVGGRPFANVKEDGTFALTTYGPDDGAPTGEYGVTVVWIVKDKQVKIVIGENSGGTDKLGGRYGDPQAPKLKATVKKGEPNTFDFDLK